MRPIKFWNTTGGNRCDIGFGLGNQWGGHAVDVTTAAYKIGHKSPSNIPGNMDQDPYCPWSCCFIELGGDSDWSQPGHVRRGANAHRYEEDNVAIHARTNETDRRVGSYSTQACIGLSVSAAKWCYDNLPVGTYVLEWSHSASTNPDRLNRYGHFSNEYGTRDTGNVDDGVTWAADKEYIDVATRIVNRAKLNWETNYLFFYDYDLCRCIVFAKDDGPVPPEPVPLIPHTGDYDEVYALLKDTSDPTGRGMHLNNHDHIKWIAAGLKDCNAKCDKLLKEV